MTIIDIPTAKEAAEIREINARTDSAYINAGVIAPEEVRQTLRENEKSGYSALEEEMPESEENPFEDIGGSSNEQNPFSEDEDVEFRTTENGVKFPLQEGKNTKQSCNEFFEKKQEEQKPLNEILGEEINGVKGQEAIKALREKQGGHVKGAFTRSDIGSIDLIWGDENRGLCHILKRREEQKINIDGFLSNLTEVIEKGQFVKTNDKGRYEIFLDKKKAVIEPEITNGQLTFLLTAFKSRKP